MEKKCWSDFEPLGINETPTNYDAKECRLTEYLSSINNIDNLFSRLHDDIRLQDLLSTMVIRVRDHTVCRLTNSIIISGQKSEDLIVKAYDYEQYRNREVACLSEEYDKQRFLRSTRLDTLCLRVREHYRHSFIARFKDESGSVRVVKYSFSSLDPDTQFILGTRKEITQSIEHDILTGGLNREGLLRDLAAQFKKASTTKSQLCVLCFNIRNFRIINELHGNTVGDKVLQQMYTSIITSELHPISYARYESDNFICLVRRETLDTDVITRLCHQQFLDGEQKIVYRSLCGIFHLESYDTPPVNACSHAKLAISFIKNQYITPWMVYEQQMQTSVLSDSEVISQLDDAVRGEEFIPYYQPVVDTFTGRIEMAEALVRWESKKHGIISPATFVPVLERHGGLSRVDKLMEKNVFELQRQRIENGRPVVPIDLNLSWVDFSDKNLIDQLKDHVLDPSVPTDLVRFEITESSIDEIADNRSDVLRFFQQNDVKLLVDDFGQGYSFGTMKNMEFNIIKLDKSLIDKIYVSHKMDVLIEALVNVFHTLGIKVVAEGVESEQQVEYLRKIHCDYIQGFYFYKPMDEKSFIELLEHQHEAERIAAEKDEPAPAQEQKTEIREESDFVTVDRKTYEMQMASLKQSNEVNNSLHMLLDEIDIHYFEWDVATHEDYASEKFCKMYGIPGNVIPNMPEEIPIVVEEDRDRFREFYARIARGEKMGSDCFRLFSPDGKGHTWYRKTFYTLFNSNGKPYKAVITMRDCRDEYQFRMLKARDRMLTEQQETVTFIYTLSDDTISLNYLLPNGEVGSGVCEHFLNTPVEQMRPDQIAIAENLRRIIESGERSGHFDFRYANGNEYRAHFSLVDGEYGILYAIIGQAEDINKTRERLEAAERIIRLSRLDGLTQIYNRSTGEHEMEKLIQSGEPGLFGILDCDRFKSVNDTYGHALGDALLIQIARLIEKHNQKGINMRLGGDEFAFFISQDEDINSFHRRISNFFDDVTALRIPGMEDFKVSVSVGAVLFNGDEDTSFDTLYRRADKLLYKSKDFKGNKLTM